VWGVTAFLMLSTFFGGFFYMFYLIELGLTLSFFNLILVTFLLLLPVSMTIGFFCFELLSSRKNKKPISFHAKRFIGRVFLVDICFVIIVAISSVINLLAPIINERYLLTILVFASVIAFIALYVVIRDTKIGRFFSRVEKGEW
jgi:hypothetical protein